MSEAERRRDPRFNPDVQIEVKVRGVEAGSKVCEGVVLDMSSRGLRVKVESAAGFVSGQQVRVFFTPSDGNRKIGVWGECVDAEVVGSAGARTVTIHLQADELSELDLPDYSAYIDHLSKKAS